MSHPPRTLVLLSYGKYALQADSGNFPDNVFVHVPPGQITTSPWAHWEIIIIP